MLLIDEICVMDEIFSIEKKVGQKYRIHIPNVSHWDSSVAFQKHMTQALVLPPQSLPWNYCYTYSISKKDQLQVLKHLGVQIQQLQSVMGLFVQSSTIAIVNMINLLVHFNLKRLCILQPAYFSVATCCSTLSLDYGIEQISFTNGVPKIPLDKIVEGNYDCIWITSPIFCTGYYPDKGFIKDIEFLKSLGMTLVFDESLTLPGKELIRSFLVDRKTFAIYSPHKSIAINGLKFATIICDLFYEDFLEQWVDVFSGALSVSNRDAILHYITPNYLEDCYPAYTDYIIQTRKLVNDIVKQYSFASMLPFTEGHYINIFLDLEIKGKIELLNFIDNIIHECLASFIPASLNGFDTSQNFGFRVNLTGNILELEGAIGRIMQYINTYYQ